MAEDPVTDPVEAPPDAAELQRERDDYRDRWMRKSAEFDNYRKRIERERREQSDQAVVDLLQELLLVVDDFDRALTVDSGDGDPAYRKGVELIHGKLHDLLAQIRRPSRSTRSAPTSIPTCTRRWCTRRVPIIAKAK